MRCARRRFLQCGAAMQCCALALTPLGRYVEIKCCEKCLVLISRMDFRKVRPDSITYSYVELNYVKRLYFFL